MNDLIISGKQDFMGKEIPVVLGGFGDGKKCICDKTVAEIHSMNAFDVRRRITDNIKRFKENVDFIDLKQGMHKTQTFDFALELGYAKSAITQAEHIYLLSERGYSKLIKIMDTDLAWEIHDNIMDEYFMMREQKNDKIKQGLYFVKFIADDLRVSESSRLFMYENYCKDVGIPTGFLPKYTDNGSREQCSATELLKRNGCEIKTATFNQCLIADGYMELRERPTSKGGTKEYKALTDKGLRYGVNLVSNKNQKECQPYYYADTFMELYNKVTA